MLIPEYQVHYDAIAAMITSFCDQYLDDDYKALCIHALDKLSLKSPFPFTKSRDNMWAAGIVYAITQNCYLIGNKYDIFSGRPKYHLTSDQVCDAFGVSKGGVSAKAKSIREELKITNTQNEWLPPSMHDMNTMMNNLRRMVGIK